MTRTLDLPAAVDDLLERLWAAGHAGYVVGGSVRDALLGRAAADWDLTTDARPDELRAIFPAAVYENRFGTVTVRVGGATYEITTFRAESGYSDHRRPDVVTFGDTIEDDLARRDFTVNAMAWGGRAGSTPDFVDPFGGRADLAAGLVRAVGDPVERFREDALRLLRAVRLAAVLDFAIDPATRRAIEANAPLARHLSGERVFGELGKLLARPRASTGLRLLAETGLLAVALPELALQQGVPQNKIPGDDLWAHTLRTVDAIPAPEGRIDLRWAALLHDVGKPATAANGRFVGHEVVGAELAEHLLERLRAPRDLTDRVRRLILHHMYAYEASWSDAAVRRFIRTVGPDLLDDLISLREADNVGSGLDRGTGGQDELRLRCTAQLEARVALSLGDLAVGGHDLMSELGLPPGPRIGLLLSGLLDVVIADPARNTRASLLEEARRVEAGLHHEEGTSS